MKRILGPSQSHAIRISLCYTTLMHHLRFDDYSILPITHNYSDVKGGYTDVDMLLSIIQWNQKFVLNNRSNTLSFLTYSQKSYYKYLILVSVNNYTSTS